MPAKSRFPAWLRTVVRGQRASACNVELAALQEGLEESRMSSDLLERRIQNFVLDEPGAAEPFSRRLARENSWSEEYARRVVHEYKRFALLAVTVGHSVTPSDQVDQAWHLHLTYTDSYWQSFCREVLGKPLHHRPSRGGRDESRKFQRDYAATLRSYRQRFGSAPPTDIWPPLAQRFAARHRWARIDLAEHWIFPKPSLASLARSTARLRRGSSAAAALGLWATGCASLGLPTPLDLSGKAFLGLYCVLSLAGWTFAWLVRRAAPSAAPESEPELQACDVAFLTGGAGLCLEAALANLVAKALLHFDAVSGVLTCRRPPPADLQGFERRVYDHVNEARDVGVNALRAEAKSLVRDVEARLGKLGLVSTRSVLPLLIALVTPALGVLKVVVGITRHRPVLFLLILIAIGTALAFLLFWGPARTTARGREALAALRERHVALRDATAPAHLLASGLVPLAVGLFGVGLLSDDAFAGVSPLFTRTKRAGNEADQSADLGSAGGCGDAGGGGCGGGCGGCGGCGGG
jgi:uncharacterized protein (TIGR04222 family)